MTVSFEYFLCELWHQGKGGRICTFNHLGKQTAGVFERKSEILVCFVVEAEKKREAKQRAKEAQERELRKREKAEEKERRRKEYDALKAAKREQEKKPKKEANQAPSKFSACCKVPAGVQWRHSCFQA